jgi:hypothetical protein
MQNQRREERLFNRRVFLKSGIIFTGTALAGSGLSLGAEKGKKNIEKEAEVGPPEDLMREHGEDGFEKVVDKVAGIEKRLGIYELAQFTPTM